MSLASKLGTMIGTGTAYDVHYMKQGSTSIGIISIAYSDRDDIKRFAVKHALDKTEEDAVQNNLLKCLEYID